MLELLSTFINTISSLVNFFIDSIKFLYDLLLMIPNYIAFLSSSFGYIPLIFVSFLTVTVSLYVVFLIIDR